jgi:hypothetical protein
VQNNSSESIGFRATVMKWSRMTGEYELSNNFQVRPNEKILARHTYFNKNSKTPQKWFTRFAIFPVKGVIIADPNKPENWVKGKDDDGTTTYTFVIARDSIP